MKYAKAFSPGHVTGLFSIHDEDLDPLQRGSQGAGFCLKEGVMTQVFLDEGQDDVFLINDNPFSETPVSKTVVRHFLHRTRIKKTGSLRIHHDTKLPVGAGFGTSGAGALSLALALNSLYDSPLSFQEAAQIAHQAEIDCKTGLGTVIGEAAGGFEIRVSPGAPGVGRIHSIPFDHSLLAAFLVFGPYPTPEMLKNSPLRQKINSAGLHLKDELLKDPTVENFCALSQEFTLKTGLATPLIKVILDLLGRRGLRAGMLMFGEGIFCVLEPEKEMSFRDTVKAYAGKGTLFTCGIDPEGARLVQTD